MAVEITWIHHASFRLTGGEQVVYVDPWKIASDSHDADVVLVSHSHFDHFSREDIEKVSGPDTVVVAPADTVSQLGAGQAIAPGQDVQVGDVAIHAVPAYNVEKAYHPRDNGWIGAVITIDSTKVYYAGDTDLIDEMSDLGDVDVALLPVGGTYTLDAPEAARACEAIECAIALPYHWGDIVGSAADAQAFQKAAPCKVHVLQPGDTLKV